MQQPSGNNPLSAAWRILPTWLKVVLFYSAGHIIWLLMAYPRTTLVRLADVFFLGFLYSSVSWRFYRASRRPDLPAAMRGAIRWIALGFALGALATGVLVIDRYLRPAPASIFNLADAIFLAIYPSIVAGLLRLPRANRPAAGPWRILLDGLVFLVGLGVPLWVFVVQPGLKGVSGIDALLVVVWPVTAFCGVFFVNTTLLTRLPVPSPTALWLLLAGTGVLWMGDLIFTLDAAAGLIARSPVNWINVANGVALTLCLLAAWHYENDPMPGDAAERPAAFSPVPMITIVLVSGWLVLGSLLVPGALPMDRVLPSLIVLFVMLMIRETLVMRDSLQWAATEAQREGQVRFETLVRNSSDIIMIVSREKKIRFSSPAALASIGVPPEQLVAHGMEEYFHEEDVGLGDKFFSQLLTQPTSIAHVNLRLLHGDGTHRYFEITGANLLREPSIAGLVLNLRDVSERVSLEERLHHAEKMEAVGRLAGGIAHDFNNLLAAILANSDLALLDLPEKHSARNELAEIRRASLRGAALTSRLLSFGRREHSTPTLVSPAEVLRSLTPVLQTMTGPGLTLKIQFVSEPGLVRVTSEGLEQAWLNLTANARDASVPGGQLLLSVEAAELREALDTPYLSVPAGRYAVLRASDTGTGMSESTRARLFEPFFTTKERGKGTGLGLASIYNTVKAAGGGITVETHPGRGTTISLWLPVVLSAAPPPEIKPQPSTTGGSETILLVEDEEPVRQATERILQLKGYRVLAAADAEDARRVLQAHAGPLHLLLSDVIMPGQTGPVLAADLVRQLPDLRVLFMSGYTGQELASQGFDRVKSNLLVKPFSVADLAARVRQALSGPTGLS